MSPQWYSHHTCVGNSRQSVESLKSSQTAPRASAESQCWRKALDRSKVRWSSRALKLKIYVLCTRYFTIARWPIKKDLCMAFIGIYCVKHMCLYWPIFDSKFYLLILTAKNELVQSLMVMRWSQSAFNLDQAIGSIAQLWMDSSKKFADLGGASKHLQKWCLLNQPILHRVWTSKMQRYKTDN